MCLELDSICTHDAEERRTLIEGCAECGVNFGNASSDRGAQDEGVAGRDAAAASKNFITLREPRLRCRQAGLCNRGRATGVLDASSRHCSFLQQTLGPGLIGFRGLECCLCFGYARRERSAIIASLGEPRFELAEDLTCRYAIAD